MPVRPEARKKLVDRLRATNWYTEHAAEIAGNTRTAQKEGRWGLERGIYVGVVAEGTLRPEDFGQEDLAYTLVLADAETLDYLGPPRAAVRLDPKKHFLYDKRDMAPSPRFGETLAIYAFPNSKGVWYVKSALRLAPPGGSPNGAAPSNRSP